MLARMADGGTGAGPDPLAALAAELGQLGRRLDGIGEELLALRAGAVPVQPPAVAVGPHPTPPLWAPPPWGPPPWAQPAWPPQGTAPKPPQAPEPSSPSGPPPVTPRRSRWPALSGARLLAWTGGAVTLLGVVLLLVLAASRGWFSPGARVGAGAVLGVALVALAMRLHRKEAARTGALALAGTGFAALYLVVAGATLVLDLAAVPAMLLALLVAAAGLGLADRWRSHLLAGGVVVGGALLAPVLAGGPLLVALVLVLHAAAVPVALRRRWSVLALLAAAWPVLYGSVVAALESLDGGPDPAAVTAVVGVLLVGLGGAAVLRRLPSPVVSALVVAAPLPVLVAVPSLGGWPGAALAAGAAGALLGLAALPLDRVVRQVAAGAAAVAVFQATAVALDGSTRTAVLLGQAIALAVLAGVLRRRLPLAVATAYGVAGVLAALVEAAPLAALVDFPARPYLVDGRPVPGALVAGAVVSALVLALAIALLVAAGRVGLVRPDARSALLWVPIGAVGLYGAAGVVVTLALLVSPDRAGFTTGHALVTVSWTVVALVLLARGIRRPALRVTGLVLVGAAVAKLVLFDLVALDGLARVAAFLGAGLVLLAAGTRYARLVASTTNGTPGQ
jgi:uncharacterized membrane protein